MSLSFGLPIEGCIFLGLFVFLSFSQQDGQTAEPDQALALSKGGFFWVFFIVVHTYIHTYSTVQYTLNQA